MVQLHDRLGLHRQWADFLGKEGHRVRGPGGFGFSLVSTPGTGKRFRWVLALRVPPAPPSETEPFAQQTG